jgi:hypothetical protein
MKTIEAAAMEYAIKNDLRQGGQTVRATAFSAGVEFAQQWTPVKEELPPPQQNVLVKYQYEGKEVVQVTTFDHAAEFPEAKITHWRPINFEPHITVIRPVQK